MAISPLVDTSQGIAYNLSATLYTPETLFEEQIDTDRWVLFAPDFEGYPILVNNRLHGYLESFRGGAVVSDVIAKDGDLLTALSGISTMEERGFLREVPVVMPYKTPPPRRKPKNFSVWLHITNSCNLKCAYCFVGEKTSDGMDQEV